MTPRVVWIRWGTNAGVVPTPCQAQSEHMYKSISYGYNKRVKTRHFVKIRGWLNFVILEL